jgi:hypothetical protein
MDSTFYYLPGDEPTRPGPLARYLPPVPDGVAAAFLDQHCRSGCPEPAPWILDPFGASPRLAAEVASNGYRTLVAVNNPVTRFLLEMHANPPSQADLHAALAELAAARKGAERLENHLQSLYLTTCTRCQQQVSVDAFVWDRSSGALTSRIYHCPCGDSGEYPATEADQQHAASLASTDSLHRARALERVAAPDDPDRQHVEEALQCYLPRAVYALITIINKLDSLSLSPERRRALLALVLTACDEGCALWAFPADRPRPKQLTLPSRFLEKNIWQALERAMELWSGNGRSIQVVTWPEIPGEAGGICLFEGPMRELAVHLEHLSITAIVTAIPRPNQAYWTLSALWAGWLWGRETAAPFKSVLRRRRYDWNWHAAALYGALKMISPHLPLNSPFFAVIPELEPPFLSAALLAGAEARLDLSSLALRTRHDPAQVVWHRRSFAHEEKSHPVVDAEAVKQAMLACLLKRSEPAPYLTLHAAGLAAMADDHSLRWREDALAQIHAPIQAALAGTEFAHQSDSPNLESGLWSLVSWDSQIDPLPDQVEIFIVRYLQKNPASSLRDLETNLNSVLPGLQTPSLGQVRAVLASYALEADGLWSLRPEDAPSARRDDLESAARALARIGTKLGYALQVNERQPRQVDWLLDGQIAVAFSLLASAVVGRLMRQAPSPAPGLKTFLVLPGGRAGLLASKLERDPALRALAERWRIVKFRHLRRLDGLSGLTRENFEKESLSDPIEPPEQMKLF